MSRRKRIIEHPNHERWLVSYADFITLLFAFFVVMYSVSSVNDGKYRVLSETLSAVFSEPPREMRVDSIQIGAISKSKSKKSTHLEMSDTNKISIELPPTPDTPVPEDTVRTINDISQQFTQTFSELIATGDISIRQGDDWLELEINSSVLFQSGESNLENTAIPAIGEVADILRSSTNPIQVEGFTDNNPINTPKFPSNWELSAARAASVVHLLDKFGLDPSRMSAIGYGEFKPIADNDTEPGRQKNRRVVLVVLGSAESRRSLDIYDANKTEVTPMLAPSPMERTSSPPSQETSIPIPAQQPQGVAP